MSVVRGDGALDISLEPDVDYEAQDAHILSLHLMKVRELGG